VLFIDARKLGSMIGRTQRELTAADVDRVAGVYHAWRGDIDWAQKETVRAKLRTLVRRKLRQYGYPPDFAERAVDTVLQQAELLAADWAA